MRLSLCCPLKYAFTRQRKRKYGQRNLHEFPSCAGRWPDDEHAVILYRNRRCIGLGKGGEIAGRHFHFLLAHGLRLPTTKAVGQEYSACKVRSMGILPVQF